MEIDVYSIISHDYVTFNAITADSKEKILEYFNLQDFENKFPQTSSEFLELNNKYINVLKSTQDFVWKEFMYSLEENKGMDEDFVDLIENTIFIDSNNLSMNGYSGILQFSSDRFPIIITMAGLIDIALFYNTIFYIFLNHIDEENNGKLWKIYKKFAFGKAKHNFILPQIWKEIDNIKLQEFVLVQTSYAMSFVYLHEYGHIALKHSKQNGEDQQKQEYEADMKAIDLIKNKNKVFRMAIEFFRLFETIDYFEPTTTHPKIDKRLEQIFETNKNLMDNVNLHLYEMFIERSKKISKGFEIGRNLPSITKEEAKLLCETQDYSSFPMIDDVEDYERSKEELLNIIKESLLNPPRNI